MKFILRMIYLNFVGWRTTIDKESVSINKLNKSMANWITSPADPDCFHHTGITKLSTTEFTIKHLELLVNMKQNLKTTKDRKSHHWSFEFIWLYASHKKWIAKLKCTH